MSKFNKSQAAEKGYSFCSINRYSFFGFLLVYRQYTSQETPECVDSGIYFQTIVITKHADSTKFEQKMLTQLIFR